MPDGPRSVRSRRIERLLEKFRNKRYRDSYVSANNRRFLAQQLRAIRGEMSQEEFGRLIGKPQSVVSRLEDPNYGKFTLQTLHEVAASLDRAVVTRIVDFPTFLRFTEDMSESATCPAGYDEHTVDRFADREDARTGVLNASASTDDVLTPPQTATREQAVSFRTRTGDERWPTESVLA